MGGDEPVSLDRGNDSASRDRDVRDDETADVVRALLDSYPDFPPQGIVFRDLTPVFASGPAFHAVVDYLLAPFLGRFDVVAGVEARGFLLAGAAAMEAGAGLVPIRKAGKLPRPAASVSYALEYGTATLEAHDDITAGMRVLLVDDVLATGGTLVAAHELVESLGGTVVGTAVLMELTGLGGRTVVGDVHTVFTA